MSQAAVGSVLVLADDSDDAAAVASGLDARAPTLDVESAAKLDGILANLSQERVDCIVAEVDSPGLDGLAVLETVRSTGVDVPVVLSAREWSDRLVDAAISAGVSDFVLSDLGPDGLERLARRVEFAIERARNAGPERRVDDRLHELSEVTNDVLWMFTADWNDLLFVNSAYEEIWGRSMEALEDSPRDWMCGVNPADRDLVAEAMERLSSGESVDVEYRVNEEEDFQRWVWVQGEPIRDGTGDVVRVAGFVRDLTERKQWERELERYESIVENTEDGVYVFDQQCRFTYVNQRVADVASIPPDAWRGEHLSVLGDLGILTAREIASIERGIDDISAERKEVVRIDLSPDLPSEVRHLELRLTPLRSTDGPDRVIGFSRDVTERVERERELERKNDRLEEFASIVSHDLRNPLNVASGSLDLGREDYDSEHFRRVQRALDRMDSLIDDLLTVSRTGGQVTEVEPVALEAVCKTCWETVETNEMSLVTDPALPTVEGDRTRVRQLFENLFRNAVDHGGDPSTITVGSLADGRGFFVADDGTGIPEPDREDVFEWGYSSGDDGTGLGLTIVEEIASAHGWDVDVTESEAGGARVEFRGLAPA